MLQFRNAIFRPCSTMPQAIISVRFSLSTLVLLLVVSCAFSATSVPDDPIVGRWDGVGYEATYHATFKKDHTFQLTDTWLNGKEVEFAAGTWTFRDGKYALPSKEDLRTGTIDAEGQLIVTADEAPGVKLVFRRQGAKPPVPASAQNPPAGEWRYAYTNKSSVPANCPPPFDVMTFMDKAKVRLKSSIAAKEFNLDFTLAGNVISIVTGEPTLPKFDFAYRWKDEGKTLLLSVPQAQHGPFEFEWTFMKPDQFLPLNIQGTWVGAIPMQDMNEEIQMAPDGRFSRTVVTKEGKTAYKNNTKANDYYRLWKAPFGNALTIVNFDAEMGAQLTQLFKYETKETEMIVTPIELAEDGELKLHQEAKFTWKLKKKP